MSGAGRQAGVIVVCGGQARMAAGYYLSRALITGQVVNEFWAPATYRVSRRATVLLERRLDWAQTQARLGSTATPTLILWGGQDRVLASWQAGRFARALPHASAHALPGCGHLLGLDCPSQTDGYLTGFLAQG